MEQGIHGLFHGIGIGGTLGIDIEHDEAVIAVAQGDSLHGFQGIVQGVGLCGGGVDANADERIAAPGAQDVPVVAVKIGGIEPLLNVIFLAGGVGSFQRLLKGDQLQKGGIAGGNVHQASSSWGNHQLLLGS